ncbi:YdcF family protein [Persicirhabdus sediminis]|uniref:YdcF family protein n=1 Tax=Persicirhabdus sediminis TaxID=454144 RepID=A0A8J7MEJ7_9BACT|nr:YdcF family protein [Persicirhabdus sediminis]MBK1791856.1 YdcF family protein [Persicirhabdus sediminis]
MLILTAISLVLLTVGSVILIRSGLKDQLKPADVALVIGSKHFTEGHPQKRLTARLDRAIDGYEKRLYKYILVSGTSTGDNELQGDIMRDYLISNGIPNHVILVDNSSADTQTSIKNAIAILDDTGLNGIFVISQYYHVPRCKLALRQGGIDSPSSAHAHCFGWNDIIAILREIPAYLKCWLTNHTETQTALATTE